MWHMYMFGLRADLWRHGPPIAAVRILRKVLSNTLDIITVHYNGVIPSDKRQQQYRYIIIRVNIIIPLLI